ncbi:hypothetical protein EUA93_14490 [Nocardioides oleivorans]|uniref:DUF4439 domain-containing protein n=1 Tax=Nocardioides oleivorans TaxID=273676 RepID=A0A4V1RLD9_9ACTN|nr:hypothetical protein [Nocardioides oleivorans]RYB95442.1 hypothetical protein EUA93_14490 [Nocardioides oleivorans]
MPGRPLSRRTTVGAALAAPLAVPVLAGCDVDPPAASSTGGPAPVQDPPEDAELVATVVAALVRAQSVLEAATLSVPSLGRRLEPLGAAHAAHLDVLVGAVPDADRPTAPPPTVAPQIVGALRAVRRSEQRLLREVRSGCLAAASGDLARVLASVAASTAQHTAALATEVTS